VADGHDIDGKLLDRSWTADSFDVGCNALQFKVDCGQDRSVPSLSPGHGEVMTVYLRIITSPSLARELFRLLGAGLILYTDTYGPIPERRTDR
jgi:hypothetical protein